MTCFCFLGLDGERYWCDQCKAVAKAVGDSLPASPYEHEIHPVKMDDAGVLRAPGCPP